GTAYDTSAQEEKIKLADGRVFKLKTKGANSTGKVVEGTAEVVNVYEEVKSSVYEDNFIEGTTTKLTDTATVVSKASVGSAYDSLAQDEVITLADGKSYKLVSKATNSTGKVAETDIYLANYYSEIKGSVLVKYVDTAGNTISEDVVDTEDSSTGVSYDTTDNKPTMILVKNADDTVTAYAFKEISVETSAETGKVVAGETVVTYVYEEVAIVPVKDVLNKDGETVDGGKATVGDVLTFVLDGSPISDGIQGGLWQYDLKDVLDTAKVEYIDGSVKVYAGEFANITLPDGSVLKADDDISSYVTIEYVDGMLTIKPIEEFYTILKDNGVEDLVDIDAQFDVKVIADGTIENTLIQIVNGFEFKSNKTTTEAGLPVVETPVEPKTDEPVNEVKTPVVEESKQSKASLPNTGTENSYALSLMGVLALFGSLLGLRKKKELE
ncbi:TPA: MucBP domain-containing protein, partial [Streptococcus suis]